MAHRSDPTRGLLVAGLRISVAGAFFALATPFADAQMFRPIDGFGNNLQEPFWGAAHVPLVRMAPNDYGDGLDTPAGAGQVSAREISNAMCTQVGDVFAGGNVTDFVWQWGQFIDHDIDLTENHSPAEGFDIAVPLGDPFFDPFNTGNEIIALNRSVHTTVGVSLVREQINQISSFIDASNVYGSNVARLFELRAFNGLGHMKTSAGSLMPFNLHGFPNAPDPSDASMFLAGDVRSNEQNGLTAIHTLFVRDHNWIADAFAGIFPTFSDTQLFFIAREFVAGTIQKITYDEWLPVLLGRNAIPPYTGYDATVDGTIQNEFSTALFRFGHSMLSPTLLRLDVNLQPIAAGNLPLQNAFFTPQEIIDHGIDPLLRGLASQNPQAVDPLIVDDVRNFLFGPPGAGGFDLPSLNVQRGRDHGLPRYNEVRSAYGLAPKGSFAEVSSDPTIQAALASVYATVDDVDAWVGGLAEDHVPGALVGELVFTVLVDQFTKLRDGDRFWWEIHFPPNYVNVIDNQSLSGVMARNTSLVVGVDVGANAFLN